ncbi:hypothetical protein [Paenibacillus sp. YN15]|uniref:hypothetical protein n=1 Tax=Paenibacillus sp. YN15 TaxID=1742774 RepID=UPI000DCDD053|nr:hypothetical protein [Paenibacillus sp. YN15]RAU96866.1 hypothetical protein DQG13_20160 [Paenibacillus sp. YN15]
MKKLFRNRTLLGSACILLSLVLSFGIAPLLNRMASEQTEIVRMVKDVAKGATITSDQIETVAIQLLWIGDHVFRIFCIHFSDRYLYDLLLLHLYFICTLTYSQI